MNGATLADLGLLLPELILVGTALLLILLARRIRHTSLASFGTVLAALAAAGVTVWIQSAENRSGFGDMVAVDGYTRFFKVLIAASLVLAALLSARSLDRDHAPCPEYNALLLLASTGMMVSVSATDLLALYLGLELVTLPSYILVGISVDRPTSNEAAIKYFLLGSFASAVLLYGISLIYGLSGTTSYTAVGAALAGHDAGASPLLIASVGLVTAGLAFKIAAAPFHAWAPDAYQGASAPVAAFLAAGSKAAGLAALGRVALWAFRAEAHALSTILAGLAAISIIVGSVLSMVQTDMKRLLAYSSIAHAGFALLGLVAGNAEGTSATMIYAFFYVFMTLGTFGVIIALGERGAKLDGYRGLAAQRPGMAALMLLFMLSLTGIPVTAGFTAKFIVIQSAVGAGHVALAVLAVVFSVVSAFVYMRVAVLMYMKEPENETPPPWPMAVSAVLAVAALVTLLGGIVPGSLTPWALSP